MENLKLYILLEHLNPKCKYYLKDSGTTFCERAWANAEKEVLRYANCDGDILKCELNNGSFLRRVG